MPTTTGKASEFITFSRTSNATLTDSDGKIKWAPHNLLLASEQFDAASWTLGGATISANAATSPSGPTTADKLVEDTTPSGGNHRVYTNVGTLTGRYTIAVFAKAAGRTKFHVRRPDGGDIDYVLFDLSAVSYTDNTGGVASASITPLGNGWFQCSVTATCVAAIATFVLICLHADNGDRAYTGNGTSGVHLWGAHVYRSDLGGMKANTSAYPMYNPTTPKNLIGASEDFSAAAWTKSNLAATPVIANAILAPNGLQTADKIVENTSAALHQIYQAYSGAVASGTYTFSVYLKAGERSTAKVAISDFATGEVSTNIDLVAQTASAAAANGNWTSGTSSITPLSDGWYRIRLTAVKNSSGSSSAIPLVQIGTASYTGDGTSGIYVWGAQLSDSASLDTYVPNYGAAPTAAAYYGPRLDADPVTLAAKGLLVEEARANLVLQSAAFDTASWQRTALNTTGTPQWVNAATAPDGTMTADKLIPDTSSTNSHSIQTQSSITVDNTSAYTWSVYAKADGYDWIAVVAYNNSFSYFTWFNVATGATGTNAAGNTAHPPVAVGNGWYRLSVTRTTANTVSYFILYPANADNQPTFAGDGTKGVLVWGAQLEKGSFPTSYIPTGAATATRNADVASVSTQAFPYSASASTIVISATIGSLTDNKTLINMTLNSDGSGAVERGQIRVNSSSGTATTLIANGGSVTGNSTTANGASANSTLKAGYALAANDLAVVLNSGTAAVDPTVTMPNYNQLRIGTLGSVEYLNGHIRQITYIPRRLTNAELQTRTA